jgi:hypothetical protein
MEAREERGFQWTEGRQYSPLCAGASCHTNDLNLFSYRARALAQKHTHTICGSNFLLHFENSRTRYLLIPCTVDYKKVIIFLSLSLSFFLHSIDIVLLSAPYHNIIMIAADFYSAQRVAHTNDPHSLSTSEPPHSLITDYTDHLLRVTFQKNKTQR